MHPKLLTGLLPKQELRESRAWVLVTAVSRASSEVHSAGLTFPKQAFGTRTVRLLGLL